ncbi:MAG: fibronectin type III domain-containing protein [Bdellovibrionales bacterium]|nr:fibronectin type III domain-containing protein [Bdellovibrionales bacterium]
MKQMSMLLASIVFAALSLLLGGCSTTAKIVSSPNACETLPLTLKWKPGQDTTDQDGIVHKIKGYKLYVKAANEKSYTNFIDAKEAQQQKLDQLLKGQTYDFRVVAYSDAGDSKPSQPVRRKICQ